MKLPEREELSSFHSFMIYFEYLLLNWIFKFPTEYVPKIKTIIKKHEDYKVNRLFMIALYVPAGK